MKRAAFVVGAIAAFSVWPTPASAQIDLTGNWAAVFHEDQLERVPGPALGDYLGLLPPITEQVPSNRLLGVSWRGEHPSVTDAPRAPSSEH